jgi:hypothetical protein
LVENKTRFVLKYHKYYKKKVQENVIEMDLVLRKKLEELNFDLILVLKMMFVVLILVDVFEELL